MRVPFLELARRRVVVLDGAMGSNLQVRPLELQRDWMGHENISEVLNFSRPDVIREIHESFLDVGCDAVETNTFGANKIVLAEAGMAERVFENNVAAARIAREACDKFETPNNPKYVVGSIGPGTKLITLGQTTWETMLDSYREQVRGLLAGGVDVLLIETQQPPCPDHGAGVVRHEQRAADADGVGPIRARRDVHPVRRSTGAGPELRAGTVRAG
jgi:5-methyltetrahydrofolate--homocysteine methyltransferase